VARQKLPDVWCEGAMTAMHQPDAGTLRPVKTRRTIRTVIFVALVLGVFGVFSRAEAGPGLRLGFTDDPDSIFIGAQWRVPLGHAGSGYFMLQPGLDVSPLVDGPVDFYLRGTLHFGFMIPASRELWIYPLLGPVVFYVNGDGFDDTGIGLDAGLGFQFNQFSVELWVGLEDSPDFTISFSFNL